MLETQHWNERNKSNSDHLPQQKIGCNNFSDNLVGPYVTIENLTSKLSRILYTHQQPPANWWAFSACLNQVLQRNLVSPV